MSEREVERWITVHGVHVPLFKGQTEEEVSQAIAEKFGMKDEMSGADLHKFSYTESKKWFQKNSNYDEWAENLEDNEWDEALSGYTGLNYDTINASLRAGHYERRDRHYLESRYNRDVKDIDNAISSFKLDTPLLTYRNSGSELFGEKDMSYEKMKALEGKTVSDKAYVSTSLVHELPGDQTVGGKVRYTILVPAGQGRGAFIARYAESESEQEFLLKRDCKFLVQKVFQRKDGRTEVFLKVK